MQASCQVPCASGMKELIRKESIGITGKYSDEDDGVVETTAQEKNITFPTDNKLQRKIIDTGKAIANDEQTAWHKSEPAQTRFTQCKNRMCSA